MMFRWSLSKGKFVHLFSTFCGLHNISQQISLFFLFPPLFSLSSSSFLLSFFFYLLCHASRSAANKLIKSHSASPDSHRRQSNIPISEKMKNNQTEEHPCRRPQEAENHNAAVQSASLAHNYAQLNLTNDNAVSSMKENSSGSSSLSSLRIVVVGDIHEEWELEQDYKALQFLQPSLVLFTGDFGNENVELVRGVSGIDIPKAAILGNHDSWNTSKFKASVKDGVQIQLECLGEQHVGYSHLDFPALKLSVVGGRPFSYGGEKLFRKELLKKRYGVRNMEESANKIHEAALGTPKDHSIIFLAHNGPTGLGSNKDDICGKDWDSEGGDYGDADLAQAISRTKESSNYSVPLVVFGHMHKEIGNGGQRKMMVTVDNTMYLNGAIVPRVKTLSSVGSLRAFTVVEFSGGEITKVAETWVSVIGDKTSLEEEHLLFSSTSEPTRSAL